MTIPFVAICLALWIDAVRVYAQVPHIYDLYRLLNSSTGRHQPESTAVYVFGFVGMATLAALVATSSLLTTSTIFDRRFPQRFGMAVLILLISSCVALTRIHAVQALYGYR